MPKTTSEISIDFDLNILHGKEKWYSEQEVQELKDTIERLKEKEKEKYCSENLTWSDNNA